MTIVYSDWVRDENGKVIRKKTEAEIASEMRPGSIVYTKEDIEREAAASIPQPTSEKPRMALDAISDGMIDDAIDSIIRLEAKQILGDAATPAVVEAVVDATMEELGEGDAIYKRENLNKLAALNKQLKAAGIPVSAMGGGWGGLHSIIPNVGILEGDVPGPRIDKKGNDETRTHLQFQDIGDGLRGVVPYMDPAKPSKVLTSELGQMKIIPPKPGERNSTYRPRRSTVEFDNPSEYVGMNTLKLMGKPAIVGNDLTHRTDLLDPTDPQMGRIDVERGRTSKDQFTLPIHLTSSLMSPKEGKEVLEDYMYNNPNASNLIEIVNDLRSLPYVSRNPDRFYYGKGFKSLIGSDNPVSRDVDDRYDQVLSLEYADNDKSARAEKKGTALAPRDISMINLRPTLEGIRQQGLGFTVNPEEVSPTNWLVHSIDWDTTAGGQQVSGYKSNLKVNVPKGAKLKGSSNTVGAKKGDELNFNVNERHPLTRQMLKDLPYILKPTRL